MSPDLWYGAVIALVSAALGFFGARSESWFERRRARKTLASALLAELRWLDGMLRQVVKNGPNSYYDPLDHPFTSAAISQLTLFSHATALPIAHFYGLLRDVRVGINAYLLRPEQVAGRREEYARFIKVKAYFAASAVPELKDALVEAGGSLPPPYSETAVKGTAIPQLPPSSFGELPQDNSEALRAV